MALIRFEERPFFRNPWLEFERMRRDIESLMRGFEYGTAGAPAAAVFPAMNLTEDNDYVYVNAEVPGIAASDLDISVEGDTLIIKGERKAEATGEKVSYHRREIERGRFSRAITLPTKVDTTKVEAKTVDGVLYVTLPKAEEVKPKQIKVDVE
ncbi:MAG: Hsp20/alpha crystallin family protein [Deltaproteobacteria bacterium]|jgi:HSP20 family protein